MRTRYIAASLLFLLAIPAFAATGLTRKDTATLKDSAAILDSLTFEPDRGIPQEILARAECILVFPYLSRADFGAGSQGGAGIASCRQTNGKMGAAGFYNVSGASLGFSIGLKPADVVVLIMTPGGAGQLAVDRFTIGNDAAEGPVGSTTATASNSQMHAPILAWTRSRGVFTGFALNGSIVAPDHDANMRLYGDQTPGIALLANPDLASPATAQALVDSIRRQMDPVGAGGTTRSQ